MCFLALFTLSVSWRTCKCESAVSNFSAVPQATVSRLLFRKGVNAMTGSLRKKESWGFLFVDTVLKYLPSGLTFWLYVLMNY